MMGNRTRKWKLRTTTSSAMEMLMAIGIDGMKNVDIRIELRIYPCWLAFIVIYTYHVPLPQRVSRGCTR